MQRRYSLILEVKAHFESLRMIFPDNHSGARRACAYGIEVVFEGISRMQCHRSGEEKPHLCKPG
jgi:hypothetical protein